MTIHIPLIAGLDLGNGYLKGTIIGPDNQPTIIDMPSGAAKTNRPIVAPLPDATAVKETSEDFVNTLDVSFASGLVSDTYRRLFGRRGVTSGLSFDEFDVVGALSKADQQLSYVLALGCFAAKAVQVYVAEHGELPPGDETLVVDARVALALPINDYMKRRVQYAASFKQGTHTVTVHNFETPVTVKITFADVQVIAEGASAQYAIGAKGAEFMDSMLADVRAAGLSLDGVTAADVLAATNTIGIDIGEGTVNFPVFTSGKFNADASRTWLHGYGDVLNTALEVMETESFNAGFNSRKQLSEFLMNGPSPLKRNHFNRVKAYVDAEAELFCDELATQFSHVLARVGASTEVAYVYGGGAGAVRSMLYPKLVDRVKGDTEFPILYLDSSYSRTLNRDGLFIAAQTVAQMAAKKSAKNKD